MNPESLTERLATTRRRIEGLRRQGGDSPELARAALEEAFETLDTTVEELRVTIDELRLRNDELQVSRAAIEAQRRRYHELFDFAPDGYIATDLYGAIREANRSAAALLGVETRFLVRKPLQVFIPEEGRPAFRSELARLRRAGGPVEYDLRLKPRHGDPFEAVVRVSVARDDRGKPVGLRWSLRDVSERMQNEAKIRALNAELERLVAERSRQLEDEFQDRERWLINAHGAAAAAAEAQAELLLDVVQEADAILWTLDAETGRYTFVSKRTETLLGYPAGAWLDNPDFWAEHLHPDDRDWAVGHRRRHLRDGLDHEAEYRLVAADGRDVWFRESVRVLKDDAGRPRELRGLMVNISKRKKVERQLYSAKTELAKRLDDITYLYELGLRLSGGLDLGPMLREVLGAVTSLQGTDMGAVLLYDPARDDLEIAAHVGISDEHVALVGRIPRGRGACGRVLETRQPVVIEDADADPGQDSFREARRLDGYRALFSYPLIARQGEFLGTIVTYFPEPHRPPDRQVELVAMYARQAADFLENARLHSRVEESDRRKEQFLAVIAHELRNPLGAILSATRVLHQAAPDDPAVLEARAVVERQARTMTRLVDDLLDATRLRRGTLALREEAVDLAALAARAADDVRPELDARGHRLDLALPPGPVVVSADPTRLEQVVVNLLTNAAKYTEPGGRITLAVGRRGDEAEVRVRDTGVGIAPELLPRVFDLFMQAEPAPDRVRKGLGIGLWVVRRLVELHGGTVSATSEGPGTGSEFVARLPLAPAGVEPEAAPGPGPAPAPVGASGGRVLVVDDDDDSARMLARLLRGWGHEVAVASDGPSAIAEVRRARPDVLLLDIGLPGIDGYEVARRLRQSGDLAGVRLVALTGYSQEADLRAAEEVGFDDHWVKPIDPDVLRAQLGHGARRNGGG